MNVYLQEEGGTNFSLLREFTYTATNTWTPSTPVYWEDINQDPATFRASIIQTQALNNTQLPDILIADEETVNRHDPVNFTLNHAASKVTVTLSSSTFSENDIENATITLPNYETGGYEQNGEFIPGTTTGDIELYRTNANSGVALFQPQTIAANNPIVSLAINGRPYNAFDENGFTFEGGVAYQININVSKEEVTFSATVVDWLTDTLNLNAITIGTAVSGGENVWDKEELLIYTGNDTDRTYLNTYVYDSIPNVFTSITPSYWEALDDPTTFYGYIERHAAYNNTQIPDWLVANPETVTASNGINLTLSHAAAQIVVQLTSDDGTFRADELAAMNITLPDYYTGATMNNGIFVPGTSQGNITVEKNVGGTNSGIALIQPQERSVGSTVVQLTSTNRTYNATYNQNIDFAAGTTTLLTIDLSKTEVTISATVIDWEKAGEYPLTVAAIEIGGSLGTTSDFFTDKSIDIYKLGNPIQDYIYSYDGSTWTGPILYWDDFSFPFTFSAVYTPTDGHTLQTDSIPWSIATDQNQSANGYYAAYDLLADTLQFTSPRYANFEFKHVLSKVTIELKPGTGFVASDLIGSEIVLNGFMVNGSLNINTGAIQNPYNSTDIEPWVETDGVKYSALVMPEQKTSGTDILTITVPGYPNTPFTGTLSQNINFAAGNEVVITVTLNKSLIKLSATVKPWIEGDTGNIIIQ
ncbi:MAG: fimbrillin family protein [Odoribacter sp.]|nr:fimbrillin family protein [Odoribacter sp.]